MEASNIEAYLQYLLSKEGELPQPSSRVDYYLNYLVLGGDKESLPAPESRMDEYLFQLCEKGLSGGNETQGGIQGIPINHMTHKIVWLEPTHNSLIGVTKTEALILEQRQISTITIKESAGT